MPCTKPSNPSIPMVDVTFEPMRQAHVPAVVAIERDVFSSPWTTGVFLQEVRDGSASRSFVAVEKRRVVGYFVAWFLQQEVHLLNIAVVPSRQRKGIGHLMLRFLMDMARGEGKDVISLEVRESNEAAIRLYRSFGFATVGMHRGYYQEDEENALLMARSLADPHEKA